MSRCFPFPPPGYERQHKPEDLALLKEVKHKEKKHKKEKKDKERRKDKEKKEKDESGEKHKDKKDRKKHKDKKEKHRDKKSKGDRSKDKDKSSISEESTVAGKLEEKSGEKFHPKELSKVSSLAVEGRCSTFFQAENGGKPQSFQATNDPKFVLELDRRIRDKEKGGGSLFPERLASVDKRDNRDKTVLIKEMETRRLDSEFGKAMVENHTRVAKSKNEVTPRPVEEQNDWRLDNKERCKDTDDDKREGKRKERDKKSHGKDKDKKKEKKKEEKAKRKAENKKSEHEKSANVGTVNHVVTSNNGTKLLMDDSAALTAENFRKRKALDTNGFLHDSEKIRPNKVQSLAPNQSTENGWRLEASQVSTKSSSDKHPIPNHLRLDLDHRDRLSNGLNEAQKPSTSKPNSFTTNMVRSDQMVVAPKTAHPDFSNVNEALRVPKMKNHIAEEAPRRAPHPDSKYLSQVYTVPKMGDWSESDDQEWLFSKKGPPRRPHLELPGVNEEPCVWSEAVHIESADVYALPYVIPY